MRKISADFIFTGNELLKDKVLILNDFDVVEGIFSHSDISGEVQKVNGVITPGFVNAHCHLELSYLLNKITPKKGLNNFLTDLEKLKKTNPEEIKEAMTIADGEMKKNGIVAVGDISNTDFSFYTKLNSSIKYHTFIEIFAFDPGKANLAFENGKRLTELYKEITGGANVSLTAHAPYSVSLPLLKKIDEFNNGSIISIHNQETFDENLMFLKKEGKVLDRIHSFGIDTSFWSPTGKNSLESILVHLKKERETLLVHNTFTSEEDLKWVRAHRTRVTWCFCPKANLYIENKLPNIPLFRNEKITVGTDSLASNNSLDILDELRTISSIYSEISLKEILSWATYNGAKFLGFGDELGSFSVGARPGVNFISNIDLEKLCLTDQSKVEVLVSR